MANNNETKMRTLTKIAIFYKILLGIIEFIFGLGLLVLGLQLYEMFNRFINTHAIQDSDDIFLIITNQYVPILLQHRYLISIIFLALGLSKIMGGLGMLYRKVWAKHLLISFMLAFIPYDLVGFIRSPTLFEAVYLVFSIVLVLYFMDFRPRQYWHEVRDMVRGSSVFFTSDKGQ